eukprot:TRINITY_DN12363_c0_g1_i1.p1 TRINITY_DN12363_c0_g1~~TRINITY_DN12363_c0_g1_i1.p1  ORF type:complete len:663 (+),score=159.83 TRINITY_DN12363_c0_g1_i1:22-1989(+)
MSYHRQGKKGSKSPFQEERRKREELKKAASAQFSCGKASIFLFSEQYDPYNPGNCLSGAQCRSDGAFFGSLIITAVNGVPLKKHTVIYGVPKMETLPRRIPPNVQPASYVLAQKWNGLNVMFFKYSDAEGNLFISCKTRGYVFARDYPGGQVFTHPLHILGVTAEGGGQELSEPTPRSDPLLPIASLPMQLVELSSNDCQSISFELCGSKEPALVSYDFELALKPLFLTNNQGKIRPLVTSSSETLLPTITSATTYEEKVTAWTQDIGPRPYVMFDSEAGEGNDESTEDESAPSSPSKSPSRVVTEVNHYVSKFLPTSVYLNKTFRTNKGIESNGYYYNSFVVEGKVVYLLDEEGFALHRSKVFKIKPGDIAASHFPTFDHSMMGRVMEAVDKIFSRGGEVSEETVQSEMELEEYAWIRFKKDIMDLAVEIPNSAAPSFKPSAQKMLVLVGIPGSGKSTFANKLIELTGSSWARVNQDEMKTRQQCEKSAKLSFKKKHSVIIDRCNFDYKQRHNWVRIAAESRVNDIRCVYLDIDPEICKKRVSAREDHPTIPAGDAGVAIIEKFTKWKIPPVAAEGFSEIYVVRNDEDIEAALSSLSELVNAPPVEEGWSSARGIRSSGGVPLTPPGSLASSSASVTSAEGVYSNSFDLLGEDM